MNGPAQKKNGERARPRSAAAGSGVSERNPSYRGGGSGVTSKHTGPGIAGGPLREVRNTKSSTTAHLRQITASGVLAEHDHTTANTAAAKRPSTSSSAITDETGGANNNPRPRCAWGIRGAATAKTSAVGVVGVINGGRSGGGITPMNASAGGPPGPAAVSTALPPGAHGLPISHSAMNISQVTRNRITARAAAAVRTVTMGLTTGMETTTTSSSEGANGGGTLIGVGWKLKVVANNGCTNDDCCLSGGVTDTSVGPSTSAGRQRYNPDAGGTANRGAAAAVIGTNIESRFTTTTTIQHHRAAGGGGTKPTEPPFRSESIGIEVTMREKLQALERDMTLLCRGAGAASSSGADKVETETERVEVLSSVFNAIIGRSKTYGHLLATIKRHYEDILMGESRPALAAALTTGNSETGHADDGSVNEELTTPPFEGVRSGVGIGDDGAFAAKVSAAEAHAAATEGKAKAAVKAANQRAAIATAAAVAAAQAQVAAEAEAIRLTGENQRLRDDSKTHHTTVATATVEVEALQLTRDGAVTVQATVEATVDDLTTSRDTLEESYVESRRQLDDLNAVLRARTQDITQLGKILISVYKGEIQPDQMGEIAAGMEHIIGPNPEGISLAMTGRGGGGGGGGGVGRGIGEQQHHGDDVDFLPQPPVVGEFEEEEEDTSVPVDSAFYGVEADEVTWEEPLSVRETKLRPKGVPILALNKLAPPPEDPDAAMLEFAYEQQYGKEEAKLMIAEARAAEAAKNAPSSGGM
eukprot:CAMPEP_0197587598 /NCGR_PEP_ID=MMETSP1326-20131121/9173_1 /TAXON_ID=1155430 /ORGANISM="Genus nov. species nov., Strain RCC2288" /LENGTH=755 /DNA_ID=CAMNT_0043152349 /DNA_START=241 /DNA_END=2508 /DNA_ORIENTATION=-